MTPPKPMTDDEIKFGRRQVESKCPICGKIRAHIESHIREVHNAETMAKRRAQGKLGWIARKKRKA